MMERRTASRVGVGDRIELITVDGSSPVALAKGARQQQYRQGPKSPVELVEVVSVESFRGNTRQRTFRFGDGRELTVSANSKMAVEMKEETE